MKQCINIRWCERAQCMCSMLSMFRPVCTFDGNTNKENTYCELCTHYTYTRTHTHNTCAVGLFTNSIQKESFYAKCLEAWLIVVLNRNSQWNFFSKLNRNLFKRMLWLWIHSSIFSHFWRLLNTHQFFLSHFFFK